MVDLAGKDIDETQEGQEPISPEPDKGSDQDQDLEFFVEGEDDTPASETVPLAAHIEFKKRLRGQNKELGQENEELARQLKAKEQELALYRLKEKQDKIKTDLKPPSRADFKDDFGEVDESAYYDALDAYNRDFLRHVNSAVENAEKSYEQKVLEAQEQKAASSREQQLDKAIDSHFKEAESLGIANYDQAASEVAKSMPQGAYEALVEKGLIDAKTTYYLYRNPRKTEELLNLANTYGEASAIAKLTELKLKLKPRNHTFPPEPDSPMRGAKGAGSINFQEKLDELRQSSDYSPEKAIKLKRQAEEAGIKVR